MTEGRTPKGEPEPPDTTGGTTATRQQRTNEEPEVQAYQQPEAKGAMGEPEPPDTTSNT